MNTYKKYCPNVYVAQCEQEYQKGEIISVETRRGKKNDSVVFNLVGRNGEFYYYSIIRADGFNVQEWAKRRAEKLENAASNAEKKSNEYYQASHEGRDFLALGEPIKVGHHSEKRHRSLIERNWNRMGKCVEFGDKAKDYELRADYWKEKENTINLSMPESIEYYEHMVDVMKEIHENLKSGKSERSHSFSLTYAKKNLNNAIKNLETAQKLWA